MHCELCDEYIDEFDGIRNHNYEQIRILEHRYNELKLEAIGIGSRICKHCDQLIPIQDVGSHNMEIMKDLIEEIHVLPPLVTIP